MVVFMDRKYYNGLQKQNSSSGKDKEMKDEKKYALLIDAENVSSKYIDIVTKEAQT